jgi:predicted ATPase
VLETTLSDGGVTLLEEPEAHLHPAAMALVAKAIVNAVRSGTQVVLTTHSLEFLDELLGACEDEPDSFLSLFLMTLRDGELVNARFDGQEVRFSRDQIGQDLR